MDAYHRGDYATALHEAEGLGISAKPARSVYMQSYYLYCGTLLAQLGRIEEAEVSLRRHVALRDESKGKVAGLDDALEKKRLAIASAQTDPFPKPELRRLSLAASLATLAWAAAVTSQNASEVALWITEAEAIQRAVNVSNKARIHHFAGCAYDELGDSENSLKHYQECGRIDTQGHWGREARRSLQSRGQ